MSIRPGILAALCATGILGCAGAQQSAHSQQLATQVAQLETRVNALEQNQSSHGLAVATDSATWGETAATGASGAATHAALPKATTKRVQRALKNAGFYTGELDGRMGPMTKQAIKDFQKANELTEDGKVGAKTWAKLGPHLPTE